MFFLTSPGNHEHADLILESDVRNVSTLALAVEEERDERACLPNPAWPMYSRDLPAKGFRPMANPRIGRWISPGKSW
jgi:hypothetical protein